MKKPIEPGSLKFPMKLSKFRRLMMPQYAGRTPEQGRVWREFLKAHPPGSCLCNYRGPVHDPQFGAVMPINATDRELDLGAIWAKLFQTGIGDEALFFLTMTRFLTWYPNWRRDETSRQRKGAAKKRKARPPHKALAEALAAHLT
jgi:hypothetical protein